MKHELFLSLGTNLGDRRAQLTAALRALAGALTITDISPVYETAPWGEPDQPPFLNLCLRAESSLSPRRVLALTQQVERDLGRRPTYRWGPRLIDIDLLAYDDLVLEDDSLNVPHPHLAERAFVLVPWAAIAPEWRHPQTGRSVREMAQAVDGSDVHQIPWQPLAEEPE
jgi:2-amino-4-hydroxy-6-hydroxymethyldihydropteridine diphosphokinase